MSHPSIIDPSIFHETEPDAEMEAFNADVENELSKLPPLHTLPPQVIRDAREQGDSIWGTFKILDEVEERILKGSTADVPVRVFVPEVVKGVYLHIHGGGFMLGRAYQYDEMMTAVAAACQVATVSVDYRLAPENPYPAGPDDCETAAVWLAENALSEFGTDRLVIGGESAGANLSAVTLLRMRDRHDFSGFCAAVLTYGGFDLCMTPSARNWGYSRLQCLSVEGGRPGQSKNCRIYQRGSGVNIHHLYSILLFFSCGSGFCLHAGLAVPAAINDLTDKTYSRLEAAPTIKKLHE